MSGGRAGVLLFDLDGTLADTVGLILRCYRHTMETHLGSCPPDEEWARHIGRPLRDTLALFARDDDEGARMLETYVGFQRTVHDEMVRAFPGVVPLVADLRSRGVPMGIVTSKGREMAGRTLRIAGLDPARWFDVVVSADDVERGKPDPEPVRRALDAMAVRDPARAVFVGDSPWDLRAGRAAGTRTAAALWGPFDHETLLAEEPDHVLERAEEVADLVDGRG